MTFNNNFLLEVSLLVICSIATGSISHIGIRGIEDGDESDEGYAGQGGHVNLLSTNGN